ncbi:acyl carrier protein SF2 chloroplastic-like [Tripterygium wilfordii]|uniref:Acyl carrier protein n=1 Tax=Tripterygium wilfordii TaxID=458696 RepID=A0A7J7DPY2_TRIWF|nr:acyl carrier protein-like [Tripterygium wilfordii]KAF5748377.1 acyl carrier protein SF2 chloroplastic-like [Tripterygium wilfordii]
MASFVSTPACPLATLPPSRVRVPGIHINSFSVNVRPLFSGLKQLPGIQLEAAAAAASYPFRSRCSRTPISCSAQAETLQTVQSTIAKQLSVEVSSVAPETKFADLGADSLDTVEIMMALEEQFEVSIGEGGAENIATVQDAADLVEKLNAEAT